MNNKAFCFNAVLLTSTMALMGGAFAQQNSDQLKARAQDVDQVKQTATETDEKTNSSGAATNIQSAFLRVLKNPDDYDANLAYAEEQLANGRPDLAAPAIERILLNNPELTDIRMLYAILLYRLDRLEEAREQFRVVEASDAPSSEKATAASYIEQIESRQRTISYGITIGLGYYGKTNPGAAPRSGRARFNDALFNSGIRPQEDEGRFGFVSAGFDRKWDSQHWDSLRGEITYYVDDMVHTDLLDVQAVFGELSSTWRGNGDTITPRLEMGVITLADQTYLQSIGGDITLERKITVPHTDRDGNPFQFNGWLTVGYSDDNYGALEASADLPGGAPTIPNQDGSVAFVEVGGTHRVADDIELESSYRLSQKQAFADFEGYRAHTVRLSGTHLLEYESFLRLSGMADQKEYHDRIPGVSTMERSDFAWRARLELGTTMNSIINYLGDDDQSRNSHFGPGFRGMTVTTSIERYEQDSNIEQFEYRNTKYQILLIRRFDY